MPPERCPPISPASELPPQKMTTYAHTLVLRLPGWLFFSDRQVIPSFDCLPERISKSFRFSFLEKHMRVAVTGGGGFLGSHLCEALLRRGDSVVCLDNFSTGDPENIAPLLAHPAFESSTPT